MLFHNMSSSETTGNSSVALTQCFTENSGLQPGIKKVSAFPLSSHSDPGEGAFSRLDYGSLALRVRVGIMIARDPLHRSGQAAFPGQMCWTTFDPLCGLPIYVVLRP
jgi:hypothetical protein